jgi:hypothetical protein
MGGTCSRHGKFEKSDNTKIPLEIAMHRWDDNIKVNFRELGCDVYWIELV